MKLRNSANNISEFKQWLKAIVIAVLLATLIRAFVFEPVMVDGASMENTLYTGDRLILYKLGYFFHPPKKGDIVVLQVKGVAAGEIPILKYLPFFSTSISGLDEIDYIKRVIAVPGDNVDIGNDGFVYVNNIKQEESYVKENGATRSKKVEFPLTVKPGKLLVMGDNREHSKDSRDIGLIDYERIKGKAVLRFWPVKDFGTVK